MMATETKQDVAECSREDLIRKLRAGQLWMDRQMLLWEKRDPQAESDERFSYVLARWIECERMVRSARFYGCIWGKEKTCPHDATVSCDSCSVEQATLW